MKKDTGKWKNIMKNWIISLFSFALCMILLAGCGEESKSEKNSSSKKEKSSRIESREETDKESQDETKDKNVKNDDKSDSTENSKANGSSREEGAGKESSGKDNTGKNPTHDKSTREGVTVTAVRGDKREDFVFDEHYTAFSDPDDYWTLDLNGNTIVVLETVDVKSNCTIVNGTVIVACDLGFRCTSDKGSGAGSCLTFRGEDARPLAFSVHEDCIGCAFNSYVMFDSVTINVLGVFAVPDVKGSVTLYDFGENQFNAGAIKNCTITVNKGAFFLNGDSEYTVSFNSYFTKNRLFLYEGATGIDNYGKLEYSGYGFDQITVNDGTYVNNHEGALFTRGGSNSTVYVIKGLAYENEGTMEIGSSFSVVVEEGAAIRNSGIFQASGLSISTVPLTLYRETLIENTGSARMSLKNGSVYVYTGEGAVAVDNQGELELDLSVNIGFLPEGASANSYERSAAYQFLLTMFKEFPKDGVNVLSCCRGVINRKNGMISGALNLSINATESHGASYMDKTIGFWNISGAVSRIQNFSAELAGQDAYGLYNDANAQFTGIRDDYPTASISVTAYPPEKRGRSEREFLEGLSEKKYSSKDLVAVYNGSDLEQTFRIEVRICGDHCTGFINEGNPVTENNISVDIQMYGDDSTGFINKGELADPENGIECSVYTYGKRNMAIENSGRIKAKFFEFFCSGDQAMAVNNSGELISSHGLKAEYKWKEQIGTGKDFVGVDNRGKIDLTEHFQCNITSNTDQLLVDGGVIVRNGTEGIECGEISCSGFSISTTRCDHVTLLENHGTVSAEIYQVKISGDKGTGLCLFKNYGSIIVKKNDVDISLGAEAKDSSVGVHEGKISAGPYVRIRYYLTGGNTGLTETGTVEFTNEYRLIMVDENDVEHYRTRQWQNGVLKEFTY